LRYLFFITRRGHGAMKLTPRKDKPCEPIVSTSKFWVVASSNRETPPEQVVERAHEFGEYLETLMQVHKAFPNSEDRASLEAVILGGSLPTRRSFERADGFRG
jgi:hypothetical protein